MKYSRIFEFETDENGKVNYNLKPFNSKGNQSWIFIGRTDAEAETPVLWSPDAKSWLIGKDWFWERLKVGGEGDNRGRDGWMASPTRWTWVWAGSGGWYMDREAWCAAVHWIELNLWLIKSQGCDSQTRWMNHEVVHTLCPSVSSSSSLTSSAAHIMSIIALPNPLFFCAD